METIEKRVAEPPFVFLTGSKSHNLLYWLVLLIALATVLSGLVQLCAPGFVLHLVSGEETKTSLHFFSIVGMFMTLFGGMLTQVLLSEGKPQVVFLWAGLQKLGASAAVAVGVLRHVFGSPALCISAFDLISGILIFLYLGVLRRRSA